MTEDKKIIKSPPFIPYLIFLFFGILLFLWLAYLVGHASISDFVTDKNLTRNIQYACVAIFSLAAFGIAIALFLAKSIELSSYNLKVKKPFLFYSKDYPLDMILSVKTKKANISYQRSGTLSTLEIYEGENLIIQLKDNSSFKIGSIEVNNYSDLKKKLIAVKPH